MIEVVELKRDRRNLKKFIRFAWDVYRGDPNFVPPLVSDQLKALLGVNNALFDNGQQAFLMAYDAGKPRARLLVGINDQLNRVKGYRQGYISLFECVNDQSAANAILDAAAQWLRDRGMNRVVGPESYTYDDFGKGMLCEGFDGPPVLFNPYNPGYYNELFARWGFVKQQDHFAYYLSVKDFDREKYSRIDAYARTKFGYTVDSLDLEGHFEREVRDITAVLSSGMPDLLDQLAPPTEEDIRTEAYMLREMADQEMVFLARVGGRPIGFLLAMPDYNQILRHMNGTMVSPALLRFLKERRRARGRRVGGKLVDGVRVIVLFVIPEYKNTAATGAMMLRLYDAVMRRGYRWGEASTVDERNVYSINSVEKAGAKKYRTYRVYEKEI